MKKETIETGNKFIEIINKLFDYITDFVDGRASYYNSSTATRTYDNRSRLQCITVKVFNLKDQREISTDISFDEEEFLRSDKGLGNFISPEAATAIKYASISYRDQISAILLKEEKRLQNEFDNLKD